MLNFWRYRTTGPSGGRFGIDAVGGRLRGDVRVRGQRQRLPDDLKAVMGKASLEARKTVTAERATRDAKALGDIRAAGINVTQPDLAPFTAVAQQTYKELAERLGPDLVCRIVEAAK